MPHFSQAVHGFHNADRIGQGHKRAFDFARPDAIHNLKGLVSVAIAKEGKFLRLRIAAVKMECDAGTECPRIMDHQTAFRPGYMCFELGGSPHSAH